MKKLSKITRARGETRMKDGASATLITTLISLIFLLSCTGLSVDLAKNAYMYQALKSRGQDAAVGAIRSISSNGSLNATTASEFQRIYLGKDSIVAGKTELGAYKNDESNGFNSTQCKTMTIPHWNNSGVAFTTTAPFITSQLGTSRGETTGKGVYPSTTNPTYISAGEGSISSVGGAVTSKPMWSSLNASVRDSRANIFLGMLGMPCQTYTFEVGSVKFGENSDSGS